MTIEARIRRPIIGEAIKGVEERKSTERAREKVPQILNDLNDVYDRFLKENNGNPTDSSGGWSAIDLHVRDEETNGIAHVRLMRHTSYRDRMAFSIDGVPLGFFILEGKLEISTEQKVPLRPPPWRAGNILPENPPFEKREPSEEEMGHIEDLVRTLKILRLTEICPHTHR